MSSELSQLGLGDYKCIYKKANCGCGVGQMCMKEEIKLHYGIHIVGSGIFGAWFRE